jgi:hypothetical protein
VHISKDLRQAARALLGRINKGLVDLDVLPALHLYSCGALIVMLLPRNNFVDVGEDLLERLLNVGGLQG